MGPEPKRRLGQSKSNKISKLGITIGRRRPTEPLGFRLSLACLSIFF